MKGSSDPILPHVVATKSSTGSAPGRDLLPNVEINLGAIDEHASQPEGPTSADGEPEALHQADVVAEIPEIEVTR